MRIFTLPVGLLTDLKAGAPALADALAKPLTYNEDPEMVVVREEHDDRPPSWKIVVYSESTWEEVPIDRENVRSMRVVIGLHLVDLVKAITREHPWVVSEMNVEGMVVELLRRSGVRAS